MTQAYYPIQQALDTQLQTLTPVTGTTVSYITENTTFSLSNIANNVNPSGAANGVILVRTTLVPFKPMTETIGIGGYDKVSGIFAIDVMGPTGKGIASVKQTADAIIALFPRGSQVSAGNIVTIETTGIAPLNQGAYSMNKLYCVQVQVNWFTYATGG